MNPQPIAVAPSHDASQAPSITNNAEAAAVLREAAGRLDIDFSDQDQGAVLLCAVVRYLES